jgi:hypothetical protein
MIISMLKSENIRLEKLKKHVKNKKKLLFLKNY